jgi:hypothetical protein
MNDFSKFKEYPTGPKHTKLPNAYWQTKECMITQTNV